MSEKFEAAKSSLPEALQPVFSQLVEDYKFAATICCGSPFVAYGVLAEIVQAGWRPSGEPIGQWKEKE